jgi:hypothetical protein
MQYPGGCHCGALTFVYDTELPAQAWSIRACQCSFCRAHGVHSTSDPRGSVAFHARQSDQLRRYRFGRSTTDFLLCARCGVYIGALTEISGSLFAIINTNALRPAPAGLEDPVPVSYDEESALARSERRRNRWTPCAGIAGCG